MSAEVPPNDRVGMEPTTASRRSPRVSVNLMFYLNPENITNGRFSWVPGRRSPRVSVNLMFYLNPENITNGRFSWVPDSNTHVFVSAVGAFTATISVVILDIPIEPFGSNLVVLRDCAHFKRVIFSFTLKWVCTHNNPDSEASKMYYLKVPDKNRPELSSVYSASNRTNSNRRNRCFRMWKLRLTIHPIYPKRDVDGLHILMNPIQHSKAWLGNEDLGRHVLCQLAAEDELAVVADTGAVLLHVLPGNRLLEFRQPLPHPLLLVRLQLRMYRIRQHSTACARPHTIPLALRLRCRYFGPPMTIPYREICSPQSAKAVIGLGLPEVTVSDLCLLAIVGSLRTYDTFMRGDRKTRNLAEKWEIITNEHSGRRRKHLSGWLTPRGPKNLDRMQLHQYSFAAWKGDLFDRTGHSPVMLCDGRLHSEITQLDRYGQFWTDRLLEQCCHGFPLKVVHINNKPIPDIPSGANIRVMYCLTDMSCNMPEDGKSVELLWTPNCHSMVPYANNEKKYQWALHTDRFSRSFYEQC
ncbi:hypothetical protein CLF_104783 [Clonorchis sinensis]|uniref:Uncharacterized protein n=1 Tax=Clonorchis sinensis TaxID=79923 RepID=G7YCC0_CLOSI|nr:hypothetical protein CLF_104783 [Clonorchis sinensis]